MIAQPPCAVHAVTIVQRRSVAHVETTAQPHYAVHAVTIALHQIEKWTIWLLVLLTRL